MDQATQIELMLADAFANGAHRAMRQLRKYTNEPYIVHPREVMAIVSTVASCSHEMRMAALLHDVIEDTGVTRQDLERIFGIEVAALVGDVTNVAKPEDGDRAARHAINKAHLQRALPRAKTIKLADIISNIKNIVERDPAFARRYLAEKLDVLEVLKEGDAKLYATAETLVKQGIEQLKGIK